MTVQAEFGSTMGSTIFPLLVFHSCTRAVEAGDQAGVDESRRTRPSEVLQITCFGKRPNATVRSLVWVWDEKGKGKG